MTRWNIFISAKLKELESAVSVGVLELSHAAGVIVYRYFMTVGALIRQKQPSPPVLLGLVVFEVADDDVDDDDDVDGD